MCGQYGVVIRRLALRDDIRPIDPDGLAHIVEVAGRLNEQDPKSVYLAADLTTSVQIGDLVKIPRRVTPALACGDFGGQRGKDQSGSR